MKCPTCNHDPAPLRRAQARHEKKNREARNRARREARAKKRETDAELAKLGIVPPKSDNSA